MCKVVISDKNQESIKALVRLMFIMGANSEAEIVDGVMDVFKPSKDYAASYKRFAKAYYQMHFAKAAEPENVPGETIEEMVQECVAEGLTMEETVQNLHTRVEDLHEDLIYQVNAMYRKHKEVTE